MGNYHIETILAGSRRLSLLAEKLNVGVLPDQAARKPRIGNVTIDTNTPAFIMGHLSLYPARVLKNLNLDDSVASCPEHWTNLFKAGAPCVDDVAGTLYPAYGELVNKFVSATAHCLASMERIDDSALLAIPGDERMRANFPTMGHAVMFMLNSHVAMHLGQFSAWRRCMGLGSAT